MRMGRKAKDKQIQNEIYRQELLQKYKPVEWNQGQMLAFAKSEYLRWHGVEMQIDDYNREIVNNLALYFTGVEGPLNLRKGIMMYGGTGTGKTSMMKAFSENPLRSFNMYECKYMALLYSTGGFEKIEQFTGPIAPPHINRFRHETYGICFEDLGTEDMKKNYGNEANVMKDIIEMRYSRHSILSGLTHITTNLTGDQIEDLYGERVRSRMREMFNIIQFPVNSPDRRK